MASTPTAPTIKQHDTFRTWATHQNPDPVDRCYLLIDMLHNLLNSEAVTKSHTPGEVTSVILITDALGLAVKDIAKTNVGLGPLSASMEHFIEMLEVYGSMMYLSTPKVALGLKVSTIRIWVNRIHN